MLDVTSEVEVRFSAEFTQRIFFANDLFFETPQLLVEVMGFAFDKPNRAKFCIDSRVKETRPEIVDQLHLLERNHADHLTIAGDIEIVPGGEDCKQGIAIIERLLEAFHAADLDRRSYVVAIGGGAVLDAVGFIASIAHRGIRLIRVPTTTLAQADVGVSVKNAINFFSKKNFLGTYSVPWAVINDAASLRTLSDTDFRSGFAEAVKVALLKDAEFFQVISENAEGVASRNMDVSAPIVRRAAELHLHHITGEGDPFESEECRPLDFGHWSAHRLESMSDFELTHGEAVAIGIAIDAVYSKLTRGLPQEQVDAILSCLHRLGFRINHPLLDDATRVLSGIEEFRLHIGGRLALEMLDEIGASVEVNEIDDGAMREAIEYVSRFDA